MKLIHHNEPGFLQKGHGVVKYGIHSGARLQKGFGIGSVHKGNLYQKGLGIGSIFSGLFRALKPVGKVLGKIAKNPTVKQIAKTALDVGKEAAVDIAADLIEGKNPTETAQAKLDQARSNIASTLRSSVREQKPKMRKARKVRIQTKRIKRDIFE